MKLGLTFIFWLNFCLPRVAQTHVRTHQKREPRRRLKNPFLFSKNRLDTSKSLLNNLLYVNALVHQIKYYNIQRGIAYNSRFSNFFLNILLFQMERLKMRLKLTLVSPGQLEFQWTLGASGAPSCRRGWGVPLASIYVSRICEEQPFYFK